MFSGNKNQIIDQLQKDNKYQVERNSEMRHEQAMEISRLENEHSIALKEKEFELKHFESEEIKKLNEKIVSLEKDVAIKDQKIEMLDKITDLNADVIDVKDLVKNLINKLPEVKINSLSVIGDNKK